MTSKLMERLARLEGSHIAQNGAGGPSPELAWELLRAMAIRLGGFPRQPDGAQPHSDTFSNGLARGLGYRDRDDMEARSTVAPGNWQQRIERAHVALCEQYEVDSYSTPRDRSFRLMVAALNEWSGAKVGNPDWPEHDDSGSLVRALAFYGVQAEAGEASGCR